MSSVSPVVESVTPAVPARTSGLVAMFEHTKYVLGENRVTGFAFGLLVVIVFAAIFGPYIVPYDPLASDTAAALKPPAAAHWFGPDQLGRDIFRRVVVATRLDTFIAVASVMLVFLMGGLAGIAAGYFGGWTDRIVGRISDTIMAFPLFVLAMGIVAAVGNTVQNIILATAIVNFPLYARVARAEANVRREAGFVLAARLSGNGDIRILLAQVLPNIMPIMVVQMSLTMGYAILNAAGLSFIGLGVRPPTAEWGIMVAEGAAFMVSGEWWNAFFPGAALMVAVFCFNLLGDVRVGKGETVGIVGESGSGKSVTSYAVMRILDRAGRIVEGAVHFTGLDVRAASEDEMRDLRGREMSMIFQNPRAALNPIRKVGRQIEDVLVQHSQVDSSALTDKAIEMLDQVRIARPRERYHAYPFELRGGMCQRVVIALALACRPQLLIADEPTTGLDVTTQKTVMDLIVELTKQRGMSTILITHDLGLAATYCDRVVVMEKGRVVETALSADIFAKPEHAYTKKLMRATPRIGASLR